MPRLPIPGSDQGSWGQILNDYLAQSHNADGTVKAGAVSVSALADGSITQAKLSATGAANGQVLSTDGTSLNWATPSSSGSVPDATSSVKGLVQLTGDLGGTAASPTVPGLAGKANTSHTHTASNVTDFSTAADARIAAASVNALSDVTVSSPSTGQVLKYNGSAWINDTDASGAGGTNLTSSRNGTSVTVISDTGTDATIAAADGTNAGVLIATDKTKLDGIATGATANSTDAQLRDRSTHTGTQAQSTVTNLTTDLAGKASTTHAHSGADITSGTVGTARLGSGTANSSTYLRGDGTWATPAGGGGAVWTHVHRTTTYTAASGEFITVDGTSAGFTVTLPAASAGAYVYVKKTDSTSNAIIVQPASGTIDGAASVVVNQQWEGEWLLSNGTNWFRC